MNFLSHHVVARRLEPGAPGGFFVGNVLPDIAQVRLKPGPEGDLNAGIRLHLISDRAFHGDPEFLRLCRVAGDGLRETGLSTPPRRVFFLAHVAVELALDSVLLSLDDGLAEDLLVRMRRGRAEALDALSNLRPDLAGEERARWENRYDRFVSYPFVTDYANPRNLSLSLVALAGRVGPELLSSAREDIPRLTRYFKRLRLQVAPSASALLQCAEVAWYNPGAR